MYNTLRLVITFLPATKCILSSFLCPVWITTFQNFSDLIANFLTIFSFKLCNFESLWEPWKSKVTHRCRRCVYQALQIFSLSEGISRDVWMTYLIPWRQTRVIVLLPCLLFSVNIWLFLHYQSLLDLVVNFLPILTPWLSLWEIAFLIYFRQETLRVLRVVSWLGMRLIVRQLYWMYNGLWLLTNHLLKLLSGHYQCLTLLHKFLLFLHKCKFCLKELNLSG